MPIGLCYADEGRIVLGPDQEVQGAVRLVFEVFRQTGSAYAVVHYFSRQQLRFPKRAYGGAWDGRLIWGRLSHNRVLGILKNPSYAGAYVFGRHQSTKDVSPQGDIRTRTRRVPLDAWPVRIENHHDGYVCWQEFEGRVIQRVPTVNRACGRSRRATRSRFTGGWMMGAV